MLYRLLCVLSLLLAPAKIAFAAEPASAGYGATRSMVAMRDGTRLATLILAPSAAVDKQMPILLERTPYGGTDEAQARRTLDGSYAELAREGFIFVFQDIRGRHASEGQFVMMRPRGNVDESSDSYDTIDWALRTVRGHNGRVGMIGASYPAWLALMGSVNPHPALKAIVPEASPGDMFRWDDFFHNGALRLAYLFDFVAYTERDRVNRPFRYTPYDQFDFFLRDDMLDQVETRWFDGKATSWRDFASQPVWNDFWRARAVLTNLPTPTVPTLSVAGWFDPEDGNGPLEMFRAWRRSPGADKAYLIVGPWNHGSWVQNGRTALGRYEFGGDTARWYRERALLPFLRHFLKNEGAPPPRVQLFRMGDHRWRTGPDWNIDAPQTLDLWLAPDRTLAFQPPREPVGTDRYVSDPANPVPYRPRPVNGLFETPPQGAVAWSTWMAADQRFADRRPDMIRWTTPPLDRDIAISGAIRMTLFAETTGTDTDWVVKLIDVHPDRTEPLAMSGYQLMVSSEILPARFREGLEQAKPVTPGRVARYTIELPARDHLFRRGHRIAVVVQSSWFPLFARNPQTFVLSPFAVRPGDYRSATQTIHRSARYPSRITLTVGGGHDLSAE